MLKRTLNEKIAIQEKQIASNHLFKYLGRIPIVFGQYLRFLQLGPEKNNIQVFFLFSMKRILGFLSFLKMKQLLPGVGISYKTIRNDIGTFKKI